MHKQSYTLQSVFAIGDKVRVYRAFGLPPESGKVLDIQYKNDEFYYLFKFFDGEQRWIEQSMTDCRLGLIDYIREKFKKNPRYLTHIIMAKFGIGSIVQHEYKSEIYVGEVEQVQVNLYHNCFEYLINFKDTGEKRWMPENELEVYNSIKKGEEELI